MCFHSLSYWHFWLGFFLFLSMCCGALESLRDKLKLCSTRGLGWMCRKCHHQDTFSSRPPWQSLYKLPAGTTISNDNEWDVQRVSVHLSDTHWWLIKPQKCVVCRCLKNPGSWEVSISGYIGSPRCGAKRDLRCHTQSDVSSWTRR